MFSGDAFKLSRGSIRELRDYINMDTEMQINSIKKLAGMPLTVKTACTGHWGITSEFDKAISAWRDAQRQNR
jgi:hypothetical protein